MLAATVRVTRDLDLAEECVQDAYAQALRVWGDRGVPARPAAWLVTTARNRALDRLRREAHFHRLAPLLVMDEPDEPAAAQDEYPDDRLRLICTCCHPALAPEARVALTLRLLCGLTTREVARSFLVGEATMAARITRAKKKIAAARIPYRVPPLAELPARVAAILDVVHLVFTTGHTAPVGDELTRPDLVERSLGLTRMLHRLLPDDRDVQGLLALILLTDARRRTRVDGAGRLVLLADQDRTVWDRDQIAEGVALVRQALRARPPGRYALQAAIAAVHAESPSWDETDWGELVALYDVLTAVWPSPVVALNRAVALGFAQGFARGLAELDALGDESQLAGYGYLAAARADFLRRLGRVDEARIAYDEALLVTGNQVERDFLSGRRAALAADRGAKPVPTAGFTPRSEDHRRMSGENNHGNDRLEELDGKLEEVLAAGPVAPGPVEGFTEIAHKTTELAERLVEKVRGDRIHGDKVHGDKVHGDTVHGDEHDAADDPGSGAADDPSS